MSIRRDRHGIPHVQGRDLLDLAHEQGRATAEDRRWQLEADRLRGEGRTAALVGAGGVGWDTFARQARIAETAQAEYAAADPGTRAFLAAYVEGVRAALPTAPCAEMERLGDPPGQWQPWTPMAIWAVQHVLFGAFGHHLWRRRVRAVLGEAGAALLGATAAGERSGGGSNAVVIGGDLTASGLPIVAGDPHRLFEAPNVYAQVRLTCPGIDVAGLAFPGVPGVQHFGHARDVAWAVTNAMADQQRLVEVPVADCAAATERIEVRGAEPVEITVHHADPGPVVLVDGDTACCLAGPAPGSLLDALVPLLRARSVADVDAALERWVEPVNNVLVADRSGRTLHRVAGRFPGPLPRIEGRPDGVLVTANDRASDAFAVLGDRFAPPYRADRLRALLAEPRRWRAADAAALLADTRLDHDGLLRALPARDDPRLTDRARVVRGRLLEWDRRLDADSADAALYVAVRDRLVAAIADAAPLAGLADPSPYGELWVPWLWLPGRVAATLARWLAADRPLGVDVPALLAAALDVAPAGGTWGQWHRYRPVHALSDLGVTHDLDPVVAGSPLSGDSDCVAATGSLPGSPHSLVGPVARYVWDLGDRGASRWAVPLGAAGDHRSPHHTDQHAAWSSGRLIPLEETR